MIYVQLIETLPESVATSAMTPLRRSIPLVYNKNKLNSFSFLIKVKRRCPLSMKKYCLNINLIEIGFSFDHFEADPTPDKSFKNLNFNGA
jgi:hypothetical protein